MTNTTQTLSNINTAVLAADGWYDATSRNTARFCTEALVDAAQSALAGMTSSHRDRFCYNDSRRKSNFDRTWALNVLCAYAHSVRMHNFSVQFEATRTAAKAELPEALEALGAAL